MHIFRFLHIPEKCLAQDRDRPIRKDLLGSQMDH
jgi:hypothetical protein